MKIKIWDGFLRTFHWALLIAVTVSYLTVDVFDEIDYHVISGIIICSLLVFRILWGIWGASTARFISFFPTFKNLSLYLKSSAEEKRNSIGHSALGALSVFALLLSLCAQAATGLLLDDDIYTTGPLNKFVSGDIAYYASIVHDTNSDILKLLILLHVLAIIFYFVKYKINLIGPMLTGNKLIDSQSKLANFRLKEVSWITIGVSIFTAIAFGIWLYTV